MIFKLYIYCFNDNHVGDWRREKGDAQLQKETNACHPSIAMTHRENQTLVFPPSIHKINRHDCHVSIENVEKNPNPIQPEFVMEMSISRIIA